MSNVTHYVTQIVIRWKRGENMEHGTCGIERGRVLIKNETIDRAGWN